MEVRVLGALEAQQAGTALHVAGAKPRAILTVLGLHPEEVVLAESIVALLWGDDPPRTSAKALQTHVSTIRRVLGDGVVVTRGGGWALHGVTTDCAEYVAAARRGREAIRSGLFGEGLVHLDEAISMWRGRPELPDTPRGTAEVTRWSEAHASLVEERIDALLSTGHAAELIGELEAAIADAPFREHRWAQLMLALYRAGRQADALRAFQRARATLAEQLGLEPGAELRSLEAAIVMQSPDLDVAPATEPAVARPRPDAPARPSPRLPTALDGPGQFVGRDSELLAIDDAWDTENSGGTHAVFIAGEPGVGKTRLAGEWARRQHARGALVLYGRCDEDLGAPYQPFAEALRAVVDGLGLHRLQGVRGIEELALLVPELNEVVPGLATPTQADPDTARYALFDALARLLATVATETPVVLVLDDLQWAAKSTLLMLRHVLRFGDPRVRVLATYRSTDLDRTHPLAAMLADLHRDAAAQRLTLTGLGIDDVRAYVAAAGFSDDLGTALAAVTGGNPFFLIEVLRHVAETGGDWDPQSLPQGVREAVARRLSRLSGTANEALLVGAVAGGSGFSLPMVERVVGRDLVDAMDEARRAEIVDEQSDGSFAFSHAIVRQSLLNEVSSVKRIRLHQRIAEAIEATPRAGDESVLGDLARHYFECAFAGGAAKAVEYSRRAGEHAMASLAYERAAELFDRAVQASDIEGAEVTDEQRCALLERLCDAFMAGGDLAAAAKAVDQLVACAKTSDRLAARASCFSGELALLTDPGSLEATERTVAAAAERLASFEDSSGEAKAHTVRAGCLSRLGRIAAADAALDKALTAARRAGDNQLVNAVLAGAPLAAVWGPSPVARAGGRCLDVVRLVRITTGSPVVESVSIRSQAVLEAFRGRTMAARRLLASARRLLLDVGLRSALLDVDLFAGIAELIGDDPGAAEPHLRAAFDGFRSQGIDADAAVAAALLGRCYLLLDRDDEAEPLFTTAELLGGHDLKAAIAWRGGRARLLARRGHHDAAQALAREALAIAERTDALVDRGDACLTLALVLADGGEVDDAQASARAASELYEQKGAVALAARARRLLDGSNTSVPVGTADASTTAAGTGTTGHDNAAARAERERNELVAVHDWDGLARLWNVDVVQDDRRTGLRMKTVGREQNLELARTIADLGVKAITVDTVATRGERLALVKETFTGFDPRPEAFRTVVLNVVELAADGSITASVGFDADAFDLAFAELDGRYLDGDGRAHASVWRTIATKPDVGRVLAVHQLAAHGAVVTATQDGAVTVRVVVVRDGALAVHERFAPDAIDAALARFLELSRAATLETIATRTQRQRWERFRAGDLDGLVNASAPDVVVNDRRTGVRLDTVGLGPVRDTVHAIVALGVTDVDSEVIEARGENLILARETYRGHDQRDSEFQIQILAVVDVDRAGLIRSLIAFDPDDIDAAMAELEARHRNEFVPENEATRMVARRDAAFAARDWAAQSELFADEVVYEDHRPGMRSEGRGRDAIVAANRGIAEMGATELESVAFATRGQRLALFRTTFRGPDRAPGAFETSIIHLGELDGDGRIVTALAFDASAFDEAFAELDRRFLAGEAAPHADAWQLVLDYSSMVDPRGRIVAVDALDDDGAVIVVAHEGAPAVAVLLRIRDRAVVGDDQFRADALPMARERFRAARVQ